jgi:hypothetical protein
LGVRDESGAVLESAIAHRRKHTASHTAPAATRSVTSVPCAALASAAREASTKALVSRLEMHRYSRNVGTSSFYKAYRAVPVRDTRENLVPRRVTAAPKAKVAAVGLFGQYRREKHTL